MFDLVAVFESSNNRPVEYNATEEHKNNSEPSLPYQDVTSSSRYLLLGSFPYYFSLIFTVKTQLLDNGFVLDFKSESENQTVVLLSVAAQNRTLTVTSNTGLLGIVNLTAVNDNEWVKFGAIVDDGFLAEIQGCNEDLKVAFPRDLTLWRKRGRIELRVQGELDATKPNVRVPDFCCYDSHMLYTFFYKNQYVFPWLIVFNFLAASA